MLKTYRIISYLLIVVAFFIGLGVMMLLGAAFSNPAILLSVFVAAAVVLYSFSSFQFLNKGIRGGQKLKPGRKDFIKVNAYVSLFFGVMNLVQTITIIAEPALLREVINQVAAMPASGMNFSKDQLFNIMQGLVWFLLIYAVALVVHIQFSFRLLKIYAAVFDHSRDVE
jgi:hypothetical protein